MNIDSGLNRLATVVVGLGAFWAVLFVVFALGSFFNDKQNSDRFDIGVMFLVIAALGYVAARVLAWVIRGFAEPKKPA